MPYTSGRIGRSGHRICYLVALQLNLVTTIYPPNVEWETLCHMKLFWLRRKEKSD